MIMKDTILFKISYDRRMEDVLTEIEIEMEINHMTATYPLVNIVMNSFENIFFSFFDNSMYIYVCMNYILLLFSFLLFVT